MFKIGDKVRWTDVYLEENNCSNRVMEITGYSDRCDSCDDECEKIGCFGGMLMDGSDYDYECVIDSLDRVSIVISETRADKLVGKLCK